MVTQKAISLKIDTELLQELDQECAVRGSKRNQLINRAIGLYLRYVDTRRNYFMFRDDPSIQDVIKDEYFNKEFLLAPSV